VTGKGEIRDGSCGTSMIGECQESAEQAAVFRGGAGVRAENEPVPVSSQMELSS